MDHGRFETLFLPFVDAAYNLARYLLRNEAQAEDVVQEAFLRAYKASGHFNEDNPKAWFLTIVRNCCFTNLTAKAAIETAIEFDETKHTPDQVVPLYRAAQPPSPEVVMIRRDERNRIKRAIQTLPVEFREVFVLRELEELSYLEIAEIVKIPKGTVMSRLSRARRLLKERLSMQTEQEGRNEL